MNGSRINRWQRLSSVACKYRWAPLYQGHDLSRGSSRRIDYSPRDKSTWRIAQQPSEL